jgi:carboxyl-terminal processing protease
MARYERGEFFIEDSIRQEGPEYKTVLGRTVYGGGGIRPDIFIPDDTTSVTSYYKEALFTGLIRQFAFQYTDENRTKLNTFKTSETMEKYLRSQNLLEKFAQFGERHSLRRRNLLMQKSRTLFERSILGGIIYNAMTMQEYMEFLNEQDPVVLKAVEVLREGKSFPKPEQEEPAEKDSEA